MKIILMIILVLLISGCSSNYNINDQGGFFTIMNRTDGTLILWTDNQLEYQHNKSFYCNVRETCRHNVFIVDDINEILVNFDCYAVIE